MAAAGEPVRAAVPADAAGVRELRELGDLGRLAVLPAFRRRGLAVRLVAAVESLAAGNGRRQVRLGVRLALPENRAFFEQLGYRQTGLDSHAGSTVPTFAWPAKPVG